MAQESCEFHRAAKAAKTEVSSARAGDLHSVTLKEFGTLASSSSTRDPDRKADSAGFEQTCGESPVVHDIPDQEVGSGMGQEFKGGIPTLIELFCGTAGVSAQFKIAGGKSMGIDHHVKRHKLKAAAVQMDLKQPWVQEMLFNEVASGRVDAIHMAPPCGTSSAARNIPIKRKLRQKGAPQPRPLRSHKFPDGLPNLKGLNHAKVQSANQLYDFCARLCKACEEHGVLFVVENTENSMMWSTSFFKTDDLVDHAAKLSTYMQPRRTRGPLLSEFKAKVQISCNPESDVPKFIPDDAEFPWQGIPIGSKLLDTQPISDSNGVVVRLVVTFGVYYSEREFLQKALELEHPFDTPLPLEESNMRSISFICEKGPADTAKFRAEQLRYYIGRGEEVAPQYS